MCVHLYFIPPEPQQRPGFPQHCLRTHTLSLGRCCSALKPEPTGRPSTLQAHHGTDLGTPPLEQDGNYSNHIRQHNFQYNTLVQDLLLFLYFYIIIDSKFCGKCSVEYTLLYVIKRGKESKTTYGWILLRFFFQFLKFQINTKSSQIFFITQNYNY